MILHGHLRNWVICFLALFVLLSFVSEVNPSDQYAASTGKGCSFCHQEPNGGPLKTVGFAYIRNGYRYPIPDRVLEKAHSLHSSFHRTLRFIIGYLHLLAATVFFGTIFYIHIFIGPRKLTGGIPKPERILGVSCMGVLTFTGTYLTWIRIDKLEQFFTNIFGLMLFIKIALFALMLAIGITAITVIHRKMKKKTEIPEQDLDTSEITFANLSRFDGSSGRPAYIAYQNRVYDVTQSPKWSDGRHLGKHIAGADLTEAIKGAPHGEEVLERVPFKGKISQGESLAQVPGRAKKAFVAMAYVNLVIIFLILGCISVWRWDFPVRLIPEERPEAVAAAGCMECHKIETPGIYHGWAGSIHAKVGVECYTCHRPDSKKPIVSDTHLDYDSTQVSLIVTPKRCAGCHPEEADQYKKSKHANTIEIMWKVDKWLNDGMNNAIERTTGCYACHGTVVEMIEGRPAAGTWPNVGVGRKNPDGSLGSCSSCHTRHRFSVVEARKPEACGQCHLGPDHPQIEIYNESKHGTIYHAEGHQWNWAPDDGEWRAGRDFRAPTCAVCHMSGASDVPKTHDVTERLSWEIQAPYTVRPSEFKPFPAHTNWQEERMKMSAICLQCHSEGWTNAHFANFDKVIENYNQEYFKPIKERIDGLYRKGLLSKSSYFDEELEWQFYELWHHEGRRARMGAAMMAPDYAWWHGFYELKHRFNRIVEEAEKLERTGKAYQYREFPGKFRR